MTHRERTLATFAAYARKAGVELRGVTPELVDTITAALEDVERETWREASAYVRSNEMAAVTAEGEMLLGIIADVLSARAAGPQAQPGVAVPTAGSQRDAYVEQGPLPRGEVADGPCAKGLRPRPVDVRGVPLGCWLPARTAQGGRCSRPPSETPPADTCATCGDVPEGCTCDYGGTDG